MPGTRCAVGTCNNSFLKTRNIVPHISYHSFPTNRNLRKVWEKACCRKDKFSTATSFICSEHFTSENFSSEMFYKLLPDTKLKRRLIPNGRQ